MINETLFQRKHQLWLRLAFISFSLSNSGIKHRLYEFSMIEFRHLKWLAQTIVENGSTYHYNRDITFNIESETSFDLLRRAVDEIKLTQLLYEQDPLSERMRHDEEYIIQSFEDYLEDLSLNEPLHAFDRRRVWPDALLTAEESDALTLFLFEESYKEYELIMVYFYSQIRAKTPAQVLYFQDLIDESHFHLRSFGEMMAKMGILSLPRALHPRTYIIEDMEKFLYNGIIEEENAKEECRRLSASISDEKLSRFFDFINYQESYHIEIMKKLLKENHG